MMKIHCFILTIAIIAASLIPVSAKKTQAEMDSIGEGAASVFLNLPIDVLDIIPENTREEMIIYALNDSTYKAVNALGGISEINRLTYDYAYVTLTPASTLTIKMLPTGKPRHETAMTIYTVGNDNTAKDSDIRFMDAGGHWLPTEKVLPEPKIEWWFDIPKGASVSIKDIKERIPFPTYEWTAQPGSDIVSARLTIAKALGLEDAAIVEKYLRPEVRFKWNGKKLSPILK